MFNIEDCIEKNPSISETVLDDELALMSIETGKYYTLNSVAMKIWELLKQPKTVSSICDLLCEEYDISKEECTHDVLDLLENLSKRSLIVVKSYV